MTAMSTIPTTVRYSDADVARSVATKRLKGVHLGKVIKQRNDIQKSTGNGRLMLTVAPVDTESGETFKPTVPVFLTMPFALTVDDYKRHDLPGTNESGEPIQAFVPNTAFQCYRYLAATRPDLAPGLPKYSQDTRKWTDVITEAVYDNKVDSRKRATELMQPTFKFFNEIWNEGEAALTGAGESTSLVGDEFYFEVSYRPGSDFPNVEILGAKLPEGKTITPKSEALEADTNV